MAKKKKMRFLLIAPFLLILALVIFFVTSRRSVDPALACQRGELLGEFDDSESIAFFEGEEVIVPRIAEGAVEVPVLGTANPSERWIEVDLSEQKLRAWDGNSLFLETPVSTGLPWWPTPTGEFRIWVKLRSAKMEGGSGKYYYYLPNVPFIMYFGNGEVPNWKGYGLHGTYWHNDFGTQRSHGCVNLPIPIAKKLYFWTTPVLPEGKGVVFSSDDNPGTRIVIHE